MPPDSTYILNSLADTAALPDSLRIISSEVVKSQTQESSNPVHSMSHPTTSIDERLILIFFIALFFSLKYARKRFSQKKIARLFEEKKSAYHEILCSYNPYYKSLGTDGQDRFILRTINFRESKTFEYVGMEEDEKIPLLISATAVQLTFGLEHYELDFFRKIYVLKDNYRYGLSAVAYEGHVSEDGIYLSWNNFIREYGDYGDGENVGLHEMAHALAYVNFRVRDGDDKYFRKGFYEFSPVARPIFERMQQGEINMLNKYAATNYEEFWACSVEAFFERPFPFREQLPELYFALCRLLNQDPTTKTKILNNEDTSLS